MSDFVDPVAQPNAYQDMLIGLLGDADPVAVQSATGGWMRGLIAEAGSDLRTRPESSEWSVLECLAHIVDAELVISGRYRWILAHDKPEIVPYDQDLWIDRLHVPHGDESSDELLAQFEPMRRANPALWRRTPEADRARYGVHRERGPESYEMTFRLTAGHDLFHIDQARRTLAQVRAGRNAA